MTNMSFIGRRNWIGIKVFLEGINVKMFTEIKKLLD